MINEITALGDPLEVVVLLLLGLGVAIGVCGLILLIRDSVSKAGHKPRPPSPL
jgi:hypothetical protein